MVSAGPLFLVLAGLFVAFATLITLEERRSQRFFMAGFRAWLDGFLVRIINAIAQKIRYVLRHTIKLSWYYSIHSFLRAVMTVLVRAYDWLEMIFINNRERAKVLRAERRNFFRASHPSANNHLTEIEAHKVSTALTPHQKKKLRAKKLES